MMELLPHDLLLMLGKRLFAYFKKWENETKHFNVTMREKVKIKLLQLCKG